MSEDDGLVTLRSGHSVAETIDRLAAAVQSRGITVFARIDHAANAAQAGMDLRPTQVLLFGNPTGGTPLMQDRQTAGLDLPLRVLAWEDADGAVWVTRTDTHWLAKRFGLGEDSAKAVAQVEAGLHALTEAAAGPGA
jgi:uncharacterized protein (DUF302 family)